MTDKKIILFMPSIEGGGVEKNFFVISNYLAKKKNNVLLVTAEKRFLNKLSNIEIINPQLNFWRNGTRLRKYMICLFLLIKTIIQNKNCCVFSFQANIYAILVCNILNTKIISRSNSAPSGWSNNFFKKLIYKIGFNLADKLIVNSKEFKKEMKNYFSVNSVVIYNPFNKNEIIKLSNKKVKKKFRNKFLRIITVGRLVDQKNQYCLLQALNHLKKNLKFELIIIGRGKNEEKIKEYLIEKNLNNYVKIFYTNNPFPFIKQSDLFILSSNYEGLPNVLLEAVALKKSVISSDCPTGPKEILDYGKGGYLFKSNNYRSLSLQIMNFIKSNKIRKKKIVYSFRRLSRFDHKTNLKKYLDVVNSL